MFSRKRAGGTDVNSYRQWDQHAENSGRRKSKRRRALAIVSANVNRVDYGYRSIKPSFDSGGGNLLMMKYGTAAGNISMPCYVFSLSHVHQYGSNGTYQPCRPARQLQLSSTGAFQWAEINGQAGDGTSTTELQQIANQRWASTTTGLGAHAYLNWTKVMFNLYGCKTKPIRYRIMLCRPTEDEASPYFYASGSSVGVDQQQHLENMTKPFVSNPIAVVDHATRPKWSILKTWEYEIQPTSTTESDAEPHVKTIKFFQRWGRVFHFNDTTGANVGGLQTTKYGDSVEIFDGTKSYADYTTGQVNVRPQDRNILFFCIMATDYSAPSTTFSTDTRGSFDVSIRTSWCRLS